MANRSCRPPQGGDPSRVWAEAQARAIIAQERGDDRSPAPEAAPPPREEPMNRYRNPIPRPVQSSPAPSSRTAQVCLERLLEETARQTRLLQELLGTMDCLAAALSARERL